MAKFRSPKLFSQHFGVESEELARLGVLDATLNLDTKLFIDPLLLEKSQHIELSKGARSSYGHHFGKVIKFLQRTKAPNDVAWRSARRLLSFPEVKWTCLGYGAQSVSGSGSGHDMTTQYVDTARQIVELGIDDPDLFAAMALFEDGVGPDRVSDMTTNVILGDLVRFNERVLKELHVPTEAVELQLLNGGRYAASLPRNPFIRGGGPIVLVPTDVLRRLPIATDWSEVADAASKNEELRYRVNQDIADLWKFRTLREKWKVRRWAMSGKAQFEDFLEMVRGTGARGYDVGADPSGELIFQRLLGSLAVTEPWSIIRPPTMDLDGVADVVEQIIEQFQFLIEERGLHKELYHGGKPRPEKAVQRLFFAVAYAYCEANDLDLTPEADTSNGQVDFKVSRGFTGRVLVEIKLSTNTNLVKGYMRQLEAYKSAEQTTKAFYLVVDVGRIGNKARDLKRAHYRAISEGSTVSRVVCVDGLTSAPPSKL